MPESASSPVSAQAERYLTEYVAMYPRERAAYGFFPFGGAYIGIHDGDGRVADFSASSVGSRVRWLQEWQAHLPSLAGWAVTDDDRTDLRILDWVAGAELFALTVLRPHQTNPMHYNDTVDISGYLRRDYAPFVERMVKVRDHLHAMPGALEAADDNLEPDLPRICLAQAISGYQGHQRFISDDLRGMLDALDNHDLRAEIVAASGRAADAIGRLIGSLRSRVPSAHEAFAIGESSFRGLYRTFELVDFDLDTFRRIGEADLVRNREALQEAASGAYPGLSVAGAMEMLSESHPLPHELHAAARDVLGQLQEFVIGNRLVSIPVSHPPAVAETPPFHRWQFASMDSPGAFECKNAGGHYYLTSPELEWSEEQAEQWMRRFFNESIVNTSAHEVYPGHYVQSMHKRLAPTIAQRAFDSFTHWEGWAHYSEEMILDAGFATSDPGQRIAQLYAALLRNARYLVAIEMHCGNMSVGEATGVIREATGMEHLPATKEAERGTFDPGYGSYTLGKLMLKKLRSDVEQEQGAAFNAGAFHDAFLSHGAPPFPIIRSRLLSDDDGVLV